MKYTLSPAFQEIVGKAGTIIASSNRSGKYLKSFVVPKNAISAKRDTVRSGFSDYIIAFNNLTPSQKDAWYSKCSQYTFYDRLSQPYTPTPIQLFMSLNLRCVNLPVSIITAAQDYLQLIAASASFTQPSVSAETLNITSFSNTDGADYLLFFCTKYYETNFGGPEARFNFLSYMLTSEALPYNLYADVVALNGRAPVIDEYFSILVCKINSATGQISIRTGNKFQATA